MNLTDKNKKFILRIVIILLSAIMAITVIFIVYHHNEQKQITKNINRLKEMETCSISDTRKEIERLELDEVKKGLTGNKQKTNWNKIFSNSVIIGDSITEGANDYGYLDTDVAIFERGISIESNPALINRAINMSPSRVYLAFGLNDLEEYKENANAFIKAYKKLIKKFQKALPDARIFINSVLPATKAKIKRVPALKYSGKYNRALKPMCEKMGVIFIDHTSTVLNNPDLYEPDGQHFKSQFYTLWLSNMASVAN